MFEISSSKEDWGILNTILNNKNYTGLISVLQGFQLALPILHNFAESAELASKALPRPSC